MYRQSYTVVSEWMSREQSYTYPGFGPPLTVICTSRSTPDSVSDQNWREEEDRISCMRVKTIRMYAQCDFDTEELLHSRLHAIFPPCHSASNIKLRFADVMFSSSDAIPILVRPHSLPRQIFPSGIYASDMELHRAEFGWIKGWPM